MASQVEPSPKEKRVANILAILSTQRQSYEATITSLLAELDKSTAELRFLRQHSEDQRRRVELMEEDFLVAQDDRARLKTRLSAAETELAELKKENSALQRMKASDLEEIKALRELATAAFDENTRARQQAMQNIRAGEPMTPRQDARASPTPYPPSGEDLNTVERACAGILAPIPPPNSAARPPTHADRQASPFSAVTVDPVVSKGVSISRLGHVAVSITDSGAALCIYTDAASATGLCFDAVVKSKALPAVIVGVAGMSNFKPVLLHTDIMGKGGPALPSRPSALEVPNWKQFRLKACVRGDGAVLLSESGASTEVANTPTPKDHGLSSQWRFGCRFDPYSHRVSFFIALDVDAAPTIVTLPEVFSNESCCPFVVLPSRHDEVVLRRVQ